MAAIYCGEDVGGSGLRRLDAVRIFEQLAAADPTIASFLSIHNMCAWMIDSYGTPEQRKTWVPRLATMEVDRELLPDRAGRGSDAAALRTRRCATVGDYVLDGVKQFISGAGVSDVYVVMARTGGDRARAASRRSSSKRHARTQFRCQRAKMGWNAQPTAQVIFEGVRVPADAMLGGAEGEGTGFGIAMNGLNGGRINIAACSLGGAQTAYEKAAGYVRDREAFGGSLLDEPTIRFTLADMATSLESSRILLWRAASALDADHPTRSSCARWPSATSPTPASTSPTRPCNCTAATATCGVRAGEDRPRSAGAPHPRGHQRNHARGHRSGRGGPGPRVLTGGHECRRSRSWGWATWAARWRPTWSRRWLSSSASASALRLPRRSRLPAELGMPLCDACPHRPAHGGRGRQGGDGHQGDRAASPLLARHGFACYRGARTARAGITETAETARANARAFRRAFRA